MDPVLCSGVMMVGIALLYQVYLEKEKDLVLDIASVWNREINKPKRGPEKIMVGYVLFQCSV